MTETTHGEATVRDEVTTEAAGQEREETRTRRLWMVERTYSSDSPNILVIVYATPDGSQYLQQERSHHGFARSAPTVTAAIDAPAERLAPVADPAERDRYAAEAGWMREHHDPDDSV
jgi:predicted transcriptional regulator